ncbi:hypothetical protein S83_070749 [Arachis hypogaea]
MTNEDSLVSTFQDKYNPDPDPLLHENSKLLSLSTGPYDPYKVSCESESEMKIPSSAIDEKHSSKIFRAKKHMEKARDESVSSKFKKGKWVVMGD